MKKAPSRRQVFVLTSEEKRIIGFVLVAFVLGLGAKQYRKARSDPAISEAIKQSAGVVADAMPKRSKHKARSP